MRARVYLENPYDVETVLDALKIASVENREMWFLDRLIGMIRADPTADITTITFQILNKLNLIHDDINLTTNSESRDQ